MNKARVILKKLRREKEMAIEESLSADFTFSDLKIIYHGSEIDVRNLTNFCLSSKRQKRKNLAKEAKM